MKQRYKGLIAATFTPMHQDGSLRLEQAVPMVDFLHKAGISALYVVGGTGEGISLSVRERRATAEAFVQAAKGRMPVIVHVGHSSLIEARELATHAQEIGADAVSAVPPFYWKPSSAANLADCMAQIAAGAPRLPFYYYHIPAVTGVGYDMVEFIRCARERIPTFGGIKYTSPVVNEYMACVEAAGDDLDVFWGVDEMLLSGLAAGAKGAVGSTYNYAAPVYFEIIKAFEQGDMEQARMWQERSVELIRRILGAGGLSAQKAVMQLIGQDCGPTRLPLIAMKKEQIDQMAARLREIGYFEWGQ